MFAILAAVFMFCEVLMDLLQPEIMSRIVDEGVLGAGHDGVDDLNLIWSLELRMICLVLVGGLCGSLNNAFVHMTAQNIGNEMRKDAFRNIMTFSFPQVDRFGTGSLVTRVTNDITQVQNFVSLFVRGMIRTSMLMFGSMYFMFRLNHQFGLIVLCAFPFIVGCLTFCLSKANPLFSRLQAQLDRINSIMPEDVSGIRIIKACVRELYEKVRFGKANDDLIKTQLRVLTIFAFMNPVVNALMYVVVAVVLLAGSYEVSAGVTTPGVIMAAITYTTQLLNGILMLNMLFQGISRGYASWKRVRELLDCQPQLRDGDSESKGDVRGQVEFRDVSFTYPGGGKKVLDHVSLTIRPGETLAIMGATGSGKTSLIQLLCRLYDATGGTIYLDNVDIRKLSLRQLRSCISTVMQDVFLFSDTIQENVMLGQKGSLNISDVRLASRDAQASEFIDRLSEQYDTVIGERGVGLSGGQKQRISIARALAKHTPVLVLDDSTSALDMETEYAIQQTLTRLPHTTKLIIAHRISAVRHADEIIVLENGHIAERGTHEELLALHGLYYQTWQAQFGMMPDRKEVTDYGC